LKRKIKVMLRPIGCLIFLLFYVPLDQKCFTYMETSIAIVGEWLQNLGICLALRALELRGIFIMPHML
jgi:hypothetical protein